LEEGGKKEPRLVKNTSEGKGDLLATQENRRGRALQEKGVFPEGNTKEIAAEGKGQGDEKTRLL